MSDSADKVVDLATTPSPIAPKTNGSGGGGFDERLRAVEQRLARIENEEKHLATKEDVQQIKIWVLSGVIGAFVVAIGLAMTLARVLA